MPLKITYTLDLHLRLVDTVTGALIPGAEASLWYNEQRIHPIVKEGNLLFVNQNRVDFDLRVETQGYESCAMRVLYSELEPALPSLDVHLIPGKGYRASRPCLTLEGRAPPGISGLCAVRAGDVSCLIRGFEPNERLLTLLNPRSLELARTHYALVNPEQGNFEPFRILSRRSDQQFILDRVLESAFSDYFPISPVVFGMTDPDGRYCLRVRDDTTDARWLVRWVPPGKSPHFQTVDFRQQGALRL